MNYSVVSINFDYYPFGMLMVGRNGGSSYRYAFNGMEKDDDVNGVGNSYTTYFRQYDSRLGKWFSTDPLAASFASMSPYVAFNDNPIIFVDPRGDSPKKDSKGKIKRKQKKFERKAKRYLRNSGIEGEVQDHFDEIKSHFDKKYQDKNWYYVVTSVSKGNAISTSTVSILSDYYAYSNKLKTSVTKNHRLDVGGRSNIMDLRPVFKETMLSDDGSSIEVNRYPNFSDVGKKANSKVKINTVTMFIDVGLEENLRVTQHNTIVGDVNLFDGIASPGKQVEVSLFPALVFSFTLATTPSKGTLSSITNPDADIGTVSHRHNSVSTSYKISVSVTTTMIRGLTGVTTTGSSRREAIKDAKEIYNVK